MADTKTKAPEKRTFTYLGPSDELSLPQPPESNGDVHYVKFRPGQTVDLDSTQLRYFESHGHHFEGRGNAVAGSPIAGMPAPFVSGMPAAAGLMGAEHNPAVPIDTIPFTPLQDPVQRYVPPVTDDPAFAEKAGAKPKE